MTRIHITVDREHADECVSALMRLGMVNVNRERAALLGIVTGDASDELVATLRALGVSVKVDGEKRASEAPDVNACERAIRDLTLLERVRKHPHVGAVRQLMLDDVDTWSGWADTDAESHPAEGDAGRCVMICMGGWG